MSPRPTPGRPARRLCRSPRVVYANPEKELVRPRRNGLVIRIAHGTYIAKPDTGAPSEPWKPPFEEAAMAYATASYSDRIPVLAGIGAARHWHAIPRAIGATVIAQPEHHRPVNLTTGGRIVFTLRDTTTIDALPVDTTLGTMRVTRLAHLTAALSKAPAAKVLRWAAARPKMPDPTTAATTPTGPPTALHHRAALPRHPEVTLRTAPRSAVTARRDLTERRATSPMPPQDTSPRRRSGEAWTTVASSVGPSTWPVNGAYAAGFDFVLRLPICKGVDRGAVAELVLGAR